LDLHPSGASGRPTADLPFTCLRELQSKCLSETLIPGTMHCCLRAYGPALRTRQRIADGLSSTAKRMDPLAIVTDLEPKQFLVFGCPTAMGMQLDIDAAKRYLLRLPRVHQVQTFASRRLCRDRLPEAFPNFAPGHRCAAPSSKPRLSRNALHTKLVNLPRCPEEAAPTEKLATAAASRAENTSSAAPKRLAASGPGPTSTS